MKREREALEPASRAVIRELRLWICSDTSAEFILSQMNRGLGSINPSHTVMLVQALENIQITPNLSHICAN